MHKVLGNSLLKEVNNNTSLLNFVEHSKTMRDKLGSECKVNSVLQGKRDYKAIEGDTGPIVYPAGHLYAYSVLYWLSSYGSIRAAQIIFGALYLVNQVDTYKETKLLAH